MVEPLLVVLLLVVAGIAVLVWLASRFGPRLPPRGRDRTPEETVPPGVTTRLVGTFSGKDLESFLAQEEAGAGTSERYTLLVRLPAAIPPVERGRRFEEPLEAALGELGHVDGGGSFLEKVDGKMEITVVEIFIHTDDVERSLPIVRRTLRAQGAPAGTTIHEMDMFLGEGENVVVHPLDQ